MKIKRIVGHVIGTALAVAWTASIATHAANVQADAPAPAPVTVSESAAPVEPAPVTDTPAIVTDPVEPIAECPEATAEDGSCVPFAFYEDTSSIGPFYDLAPCTSDGPAESENCYWDASERGDGTGSDFILLNGVTYYPGG